MATYEFKLVEQLLRDYPDMPKEIKRRRLQLKYPVKEKEENVGGSKSHSDISPQEMFVITLDQDKRLNKLEEEHEIIANIIDKLPEKSKQIIKMYYFDHYTKYTWRDVAIQVNYSVRNCIDIRDNVVNSIGKRLGIMD